MSSSLYAIFGMVITGVVALLCLQEAVHNDRWPTSFRFRYQVIWLLCALTLMGGLAGFTVGKILIIE
jgi:hypothetical protein